MKAFLAIVLGIVAGAACAAHDSAAVPDQRLLHARLDAQVPAWLAGNAVPSVAIAHIQRSRLVLDVAYGMQSPGIPVTADTLYNIASMAKPISAEVVLRLAAQKRLSLDEPMHEVWTDPDIANDERRKLLTPRLALSHRSGFPNWRYETEGVLKFLRAPGEAFGYSGEGFEYMARFAANKTGTAFEQLAQQLVLDPIGMQNTAYTRRDWFEGRIAIPHDAAGKALEPQIADTALASDDVYSTAGDYAKFLISVTRNQGLSKSIARERGSIQVDRKSGMCSAAMKPDCPDEAGFGLGWEVFTFEGQTVLMHTGMDAGTFTLGYFNAATGDGTVIFTNSSNGPKMVLPILDLIGKDRAFVQFLRRQVEG